MRSYNIKINGKVVRTVGGEKAGRFATNTTKKQIKRLRKRPVAKQRHILSPLIPILWILLIATCCTGIAEFNQTKPLTAEPMKVEKVEAQGSFESADIPADYVEPDLEPDLFDKYFGDKADEARKVAQCESGMNPNATNLTDDWGIMQINAKTWIKHFGVTRQDLLDEETNIRLASEIYKTNGNWYDWRFSKKCHQLK